MGGPPCQPFSFKNRFKDQKEAILKRLATFEYLSLIEIIRPPIIYMENVYQMTQSIDDNNHRLTDKIFIFLNFLGYDVSEFLMRASQHGLAQSRDRLIFTAVHTDSIYNLPERPTITHNPFIPKDRTLGYHYGTKEKVPGIFGVFKALYSSRVIADHIFDLPRIGNGDNIRSFMPSNHWTDCKKNITNLEETEWHGEAKSMTTSSPYRHPSEDRHLTPREIACFQGFPLDYHFGVWNLIDMNRGLGNAVPVNVSFALAVELLRANTR